MRKLVLSTALAMLTALPAVAQEKVMIGEPSWTGAQVIAKLIKVVITERLGGQADTVPGTNPVIFQAMSRGKGDIDVHPDVWLPNQQGLVDEYLPHGTIRLSKSGYVGEAGFCVPTYMVEQGIKSIYDLATPEAAAMLDTDGDGESKIWVGGSGWAATNIRTVKMRDYGLDQFHSPSSEDEAFAYASLGNAIRAKEGFVLGCYKPHYIFALYDLKILEEPPYDPAKYVMNQPSDDANWFENSSVSTADEKKTIKVGYSTSLEERAPAVANFLAAIELDTDTVSNWTYQVAQEGRDAEEVVREWVAENSDRVDGWLGI